MLPDVFTRAQALAAGWTPRRIDRRVATGEWTLLLRGVYWVHPPASVPLSVACRAALLAGPPGALLGFAAAASVRGLPVPGSLTRTPIAIDVLVPSSVGRRPRTGGLVRVRWRRMTVHHRDRGLVDGLAVTSAARTVTDLLPSLDTVEAVCLLDAARNSGGIAPADFSALAARPCFAAACALSDARAQSPLETRARLACVEAGIPPDALQLPIHDRHGQLLGYGDLAWLRSSRTLWCSSAMERRTTTGRHRCIATATGRTT